MIKKGLFILILLPFFVKAQVVHEFLMARMNGQITLDDGHVTNFWGFGPTSFQPNGRIFLPAPTLRYTKGDSVVIHFYNNSQEDHTIHLHGLDVDQANDGVPSTSFAVSNFDSTLYRFKADYAGTYLYHCHVLTTLHLTMGMYGLIVVENGDGKLYDNGPGYSKKYEFLASDMKRAVNDNPISPGIFYHLYPDYFMINGGSTWQIHEDTNNIISYIPDDSIAFRLANIGYSCNTYYFPEGFNARVFMSDGREIPNSFSTDSLTLFPGERYSIIANPNSIIQDSIQVDYCNMSTGEVVGTNYIRVNLNPAYAELQSYNDEENELIIYPNPAKDLIHVEADNNFDRLEVFDLNGKLIARYQLSKGKNTLPTHVLNRGVYLVRLGEKVTRLVKK